MGNSWGQFWSLRWRSISLSHFDHFGFWGYLSFEEPSLGREKNGWWARISTVIMALKWPLPGRHCTAAGGQQPKQPETCLVIVRDVHDRSVKGDFMIFYADFMLILWWFGDDVFCHRMSSSWWISHQFHSDHSETLLRRSLGGEECGVSKGLWETRQMVEEMCHSKGNNAFGYFLGFKMVKNPVGFL